MRAYFQDLSQEEKRAIREQRDELRERGTVQERKQFRERLREKLEQRTEE
jgi:hypothetical protein